MPGPPCRADPMRQPWEKHLGSARVQRYPGQGSQLQSGEKKAILNAFFKKQEEAQLIPSTLISQPKGFFFAVPIHSAQGMPQHRTQPPLPSCKKSWVRGGVGAFSMPPTHSRARRGPARPRPGGRGLLELRLMFERENTSLDRRLQHLAQSQTCL